MTRLRAAWRAVVTLRIVRHDRPASCLELVRPDGYGWYLLPMPRRKR